MDKIAVIGAGLIGRGWAIVFARAGHDVALYDINADALPPAMATLKRNLGDLARFGLIDEAPETVLARVTPVTGLSEAVADAAYVQECALERIDVKQQVYAELDAAAGPDAVLASSASFAPVSSFAADLPGRGRCLVAHPVNPPYLIPVVELVPGPWTDEAVLERARALMQSVGQKPVVIRSEKYGFVLNRLQAALLNEAFRLVEDGVTTPEELDVTISDGLGLRWSFMGPFETIDLNAPGGIHDYAERARGPMHTLAKEQSDPRQWSPDLVGKILAARRKLLPESGLGEAQEWRDRRLMALAAHKASATRDVPK